MMAALDTLGRGVVTLACRDVSVYRKENKVQLANIFGDV